MRGSAKAAKQAGLSDETTLSNFEGRLKWLPRGLAASFIEGRQYVKLGNPDKEDSCCSFGGGHNGMIWFDKPLE